MTTDEFLQTLFQPDDVIEIRPIPMVDGYRFFGTVADIIGNKEMERWQALNSRGANIYFGVLPRGEDPNGNKSGKADHLTGGRTIWADLDDMRDEDQIKRDIERAGLPWPNIGIASGHGTHLYWLLDGFESAFKIGACVERVAKALGGDTAVKDPARIMRLPGFLNVKRQPHIECRVLWSGGERVGIDRFPTVSDKSPQSSPVTMSIDAPQRAQAYLDTIDGAMEGGRSNVAYRASCAVCNDFGVDGETAYAMIWNWNIRKLFPPLEENELRKIVASAQKNAKKPAREKLDMPLERASVTVNSFEGLTCGGVPVDDDARIDREFAKSRGIIDPGPFPEKYLTVPGLIGELSDWTIEHAIKRQPVLSLAAALALQATLCARKVHDAYGIWANVYICGIGVTGCGKEFARKKNVDIMNACGMGGNLSDGAKSGSAVMNALANNPVRFWQIDEYGQWLQASIGRGSAQWLKDITECLLQLYSRSDSIYKTADLADTGLGGKTLMGPHAIIYGTTTPDALWNSITPESIQQGFVSRQIFFDTDGHNPDEDDYRPSEDLPESFFETARWWSAYDPDDSAEGVNLFASRTIDRTPEAQEIANEFKNRTNREMKGYDDPVNLAVCGRRKENSFKLALLYAVSANPANPVIDQAAMSWGTGLGEYLNRKTLWAVDQSVSSNAFQKGAKEAMRLIRRSGGSGIARSDLTKRLGLPPREFDAIMAHIDERGCGLACQYQSETGGRPKIMIKACGR